MQRRALAVLLALTLAACGDDPSPAPPPDDPGGGDTGGGGGGGGGGGDGGSGGGGGGGGDDGGPAEPPSDPSVTIRRLDAAAECDGLLPDRAPPAVTAEVSDGSSCGPGVSEGGGHVAVQRDASRGGRAYQVFSPDGRPEERFVVSSPRSACWLQTTCGPLFPQEDGFQAFRATGGTGSHDRLTVEVHAYAADGALRRTETPVAPEMWTQSFAAAEDPRGGTLLVTTGDPPPPTGARCNGQAFRFGADGAARGSAELGCGLVAGGVSNRGEALVLQHRSEDPLRTFLRWLAPDGRPARAEASELTPWTYGPQLAPLLDGSLALNDGGAWTRVFPRLGAASEPAPAWLAGKHGWAFRFTRGNRGYALFPPPGQELADCAPGLEVRAPSGRLCGTITFREEGGACRSAALDQGWDGTVVQQSGRQPCRWRWWPRLLAKP